MPHKKIVSLSERPWDYVLEKQMWPEKRRTGTILTVWYEEMFWYDNSGEKSFQASDRWSICWQTATYALIQKQVTTPRNNNEHQHICIGMAARLTSEFNRKSHPYIRFILFQQQKHIRSLFLLLFILLNCISTQTKEVVLKTMPFISCTVMSPSQTKLNFFKQTHYNTTACFDTLVNSLSRLRTAPLICGWRNKNTGFWQLPD